jgi:hypothetical protein
MNQKNKDYLDMRFPGTSRSVLDFDSAGVTDSPQGTWRCTLTIFRATFGQIPEPKVYPEEIKEWRLILMEESGKFAGDTSSPLDSILPQQMEKIILVLPGEMYHPGTWKPTMPGYTTGKVGPVYDWRTVTPYKVWVLGTDKWHNVTSFQTPIFVRLEVCDGGLIPDTIYPSLDTLATKIGEIDGQPIFITKTYFEVSYRETGRGKLIAKNGGKSSFCEAFNVLKPPPSEKDRIRIAPNPAGAAGDAEIVIWPAYVTDIKVYILDCFGYIVKDFSEEAKEKLQKNPTDYCRLVWDCKNDKGEKVGSGIYHVCVQMFQVQEAGVFKKKLGVAW